MGRQQLSRCGSILAILAAALVARAEVARAEVRVQPDKENVVASRLAGAWVPHPELTARLTEKAAAGETPGGGLTFTVDATVAGKLPAKYEPFLADKVVYLAGQMTTGGQSYPFILIENRGNPHIIWFRPAADEPMGDAESFNVALIPAADTANDLLFAGGDFNNQPFRALKRAAGARPAGGTPDTPIRNWLKACKQSDIELLKTVFSKRMQTRFQQQDWQTVLKLYQSLWKDQFGAYELSDFTFTFEGGDETGKVKISFKGKELPGLRVVKEDGQWKVDEQ